MSLWLVNETPTADLLKPGGLVQFSLKSDAGHPRIGTLMAKFGISRLRHNKMLPDLDPNLAKYGHVHYTSPERTVPYTGECLRSIGAGRLIITKQTDDTADLGVYEYTVPVNPGSSSLAYFKIRKHDWQVGARPWIAAGSVSGLRLGLSSGLLKTSCDLFLQDDGGDGALLVTGPIDGAERSHEVAYPFPWKTVPENGAIEVWIHLNHGETPSFEVWARLAGGELSRVASVELSVLSDNASNIENSVTAYFGNGGWAGDVLDIESWELYPDFRDIVNSSDALPGNSILFAPDAPTIYRADSGKLPTEAIPTRWFPFGKVRASFGFDPGRKVTPQSVVLDKYELVGEEKVAYTGRSGYERSEPAIGSQNDGFMVEAFMSGFAKHVDVESFGAGIGVNDGTYSYRALFFKAATRNTIVIQSSGDQTSLEEQHDSGKLIDWELMRLVRLAVDRARSKVSLWVDDDLVVEKPLGRLFPKTRKVGVEFGHLLDVVSQGQVNIGFMNYLTKYSSFEAADEEAPHSGAAPVPFVRRRIDPDGSWNFMDGAFQIKKASFHTNNTKYEYFREEKLDVSTGALVDFNARVPMFWDAKGTPMAASASTGAGVMLHLGSKVLRVGFYNCGVHGKFIGVLPGSGTANDIINQTALGRQFSAPVDWTKFETYRVVCRAYDRIEIWVGKTTNKAAIIIPWRSDTEGFDLPAEKQGQASGISFGHDEGMPASISEWKFVRWGVSTGYDIAVSQGYPNGIREDQYGGKSLLLTDIDEDT